MLWGGKLLVETILRQTRTPSSVHSTEEWDKLPQQLLDNVVQSMESKTRHRVSLVSAHNDLGGGFKAATSLPDSPQRCSIGFRSGDRAGHSIRSKPSLLQMLLNNPSSVRSCIIIHQNEVVTNRSSIWADIWIKDLSSRYQDQLRFLHGTHAGQCVHCGSEILRKPGFHHLYNCVFPAVLD
ncbi:hypothetical protein TNCV_808571 [Trichonephila clavipes]|nr:hypothetical protein TNCV_808571 [Trichonephila clavipes]